MTFSISSRMLSRSGPGGSSRTSFKSPAARFSDDQLCRGYGVVNGNLGSGERFGLARGVPREPPTIQENGPFPETPVNALDCRNFKASVSQRHLRHPPQRAPITSPSPLAPPRDPGPPPGSEPRNSYATPVCFGLHRGDGPAENFSNLGR
jgi:hypothetical protein